MIRYLRHKEIDTQRWDENLERCINAMPYAYSWYLDKVCGGHWDALVNDDYSALFPLPRKDKLGVSALYQPFFTQQLGLFTSQFEELSRIDEWVAAIPFRFVKKNLHLNHYIEKEGLPTRVTHHILLNRDYFYIYDNYSSIVRKNLKRIQNKGVQAESSKDVYSFTGFMTQQLGNKLSDLSAGDMDMLQDLLAELLERKKGFIRYAIDKEGHRIAGTFIVKSNSRCIYLLAASTEKGKKLNGMTFVIDSVIRELAGKEIIFDFEGSMIPGIANFYRNFGAEEVRFPVLKRWF